MPYALHLTARVTQVAADLERALNSPGNDLLPAALAIARVEYPSLDTTPYLAMLEQMGRDAARRLHGITGDPTAAIAALNEYLYDEEGFSGNRDSYDDPRNSLLNEVLDRRTGIPISLAVIYMEVASRAGLRISGVNFPGHFLLRAAAGMPGEDLIIDPDAQAFMAARAGSTVVRLDDASHAGAYTHYASRFVKLIEQAATATGG